MSVQIDDNSGEVRRKVEKALMKAARMIGGTVAGHATELAPRDTGLLANSITFAIGGEPPEKMSYQGNDKDKNGNPIEVKEGHYEGVAPADDDGEITVYVGTNVEHGTYNELGTVKMNARPFLRPAFENFREEINQIFEKNLSELR